jgi:Protein of unknown function (DUF3137).
MNLETIEINRHKRLKTFYILFFIGLALLALAIVFILIYFLGNVETFTLPGFAILIVGIILIVLSFTISSNRYETFVKDTLEKSIMEEVYKDNKFTYVQNNGISFKEMNYSGMFRMPDEFQTSDTIRSTYKDVEFVVSDYIFTRITTTTDSHGHHQQNRYPYPGRYMSFHLERNFGAGLAIVEKRNNCDVINTNLYKEKVDFESIDFAKRFITTASDRQKAFYLIRPKEIMDLLEIDDKYKGNIVNILVNNMVYFLLADTQIVFHYSIFHKIDESLINDVKAYYELPLRIIDILNLSNSKFNSTDL